MNLESNFDAIPILLVLGASVVMMVLSFEIGARLGTAHKKKRMKEQLSQVRSLMGAGLGMLAFMLGFSFNIAQSHFEKRNEAFLLEINAINTAYLSAGLLSPEDEAFSRSLLQDFVAARISLVQATDEGRMEEVVEEIQAGEDLLHSLWLRAEAVETVFSPESSAGFAGSVLNMISANEGRKHAAIYNRIPPIIWISLSLVTALSMLVVGYHAGLTGTRSRVASWTLAFSFSLVLALVADLDRPRMTFFSVNQQQMMDLQKSMGEP